MIWVFSSTSFPEKQVPFQKLTQPVWMGFGARGPIEVKTERSKLCYSLAL